MAKKDAVHDRSTYHPEVKVRDTFTVIKAVPNATIEAMLDKRWLVKDPTDKNERSSYGWRQRVVINDAGRAVLKAERKRRRSSGEDTAIVVGWESGAAEPVPIKAGCGYDRNRRLAMAMHDVVSLLVTKKAGRVQKQSRQADGEFGGATERLFPGDKPQYAVYMQPNAVEAIRVLMAAINTSLEDTYAAGQRKGSSILMHLADGSETLHKFESEEVRRSRREACAWCARGNKPELLDARGYADDDGTWQHDIDHSRYPCVERA